MKSYDKSLMQNPRKICAMCVIFSMLSITPMLAAESKFHSADISSSQAGRDFSLKDPDGKTRQLADFRGKAVLIFFGFTQCPVICPTALSRAAQTRKLLGDDGKRLQVIFVSLDPERDTPALLRGYTQAFDPSFLGLSSDVDHIKSVAENFKIIYSKIPTGSSYTMDHSVISYIYDPAGKIRLAVSHDTTASESADDIRLLLNDFPETSSIQSTPTTPQAQ